MYKIHFEFEFEFRIFDFSFKPKLILSIWNFQVPIHCTMRSLASGAPIINYSNHYGSFASSIEYYINELFERRCKRSIPTNMITNAHNYVTTSWVLTISHSSRRSRNWWTSRFDNWFNFQTHFMSQTNGDILRRAF